MKRLLTLAVIAVCVLVLAGCAKVSKLINMADQDKNLTIEYGWTVTGTSPHEDNIGIVLTNNGDLVATDITVKFIPYDKDNKEITYSEEDPGWGESFGPAENNTVLIDSIILPGSKTAFIDDGFTDLKEAPDHFKATIESVEWKDVSEIAEGDVTVEDYSYDVGSDYAIVTLKNTTDNEYDSQDKFSLQNLEIFIIGYDSDGNIVGGDSSYYLDLSAGKEADFEILLDGRLANTNAETAEIFVSRVDFDPGTLIEMETDGHTYTAEEITEYYESKKK